MKNPQIRLDLATREIARIEEEIRELERQRGLHAEDARKAKLLLNGIRPCDKCGRLVPSPCHDAAGFHEAGPWDYSCREVFYPPADYPSAQTYLRQSD